MPNKKQRARAASRAGATPQPQAQPSGPAIRPGAMLSTLRLISLLGATAVALLVYELLADKIAFGWALAVGFVAGIIARAALLWLERVWLRAAARRAQSLDAPQRNEQPKPR